MRQAGSAKTLVALFFAATLLGCATANYKPDSYYLEMNVSALPDRQLLTFFYELVDRVGLLGGDKEFFLRQGRFQAGSSDIYRNFGMKRAARESASNAIGSLLVAALAEYQLQQFRDKAILTRVELESRGWSPGLGFARGMSREGTVRYIQRPATDPAESAAPSASESRGPAYAGIQFPAPYEPPAAKKALGEMMAEAEKLAKEQGCRSPKGAELLTERGPIETYRVQCGMNEEIIVKCDYRVCRILK